MAGVVGFEPTQHTGSKPAALPTRLHPNINKTHNIDNLILCQTRKPIPPKKQQQLSVGLEPTILYQREFAVCVFMVEDVGFEPRFKLPKLACYHYTTSSILVPGTGLEPISSDYQSLILNQLYYPGIIHQKEIVDSLFQQFLYSELYISILSILD